MELLKIREAAKELFKLLDLFNLFNNFESLDNEKRDKLYNSVFVLLDKLEKELCKWKADYKNKGLLDMLKTAKVAELPKRFNTFFEEIENQWSNKNGFNVIEKPFIFNCRLLCDKISQDLEFFKIAQPQQLPKELETKEAKRYFAKAIELGLMNNNYKWLKGLQMLSCFAREMSLKLCLSNAVNSDKTMRIAWKPFEELFGIDKGKLRSNYNDIQKTGNNPKEIGLIDEVFK